MKKGITQRRSFSISFPEGGRSVIRIRPQEDGPKYRSLSEQSLRLYPCERKSPYDAERICRMKDQQGIPHTEQMRIHSMFRGSARAEPGVSQVSIARCKLNIFLRHFIVRDFTFRFVIHWRKVYKYIFEFPFHLICKWNSFSLWCLTKKVLK